MDETDAIGRKSLSDALLEERRRKLDTFDSSL